MATQEQHTGEEYTEADLKVPEYFPWKGDFTRIENNPVFEPAGSGRDSAAEYNTALAVDEEGRIHAFIREEDTDDEEGYVSRVVHAVSTPNDPLNFERTGQAILPPGLEEHEDLGWRDEDDHEYRVRGEEDPRVTTLAEPIEDESGDEYPYLMTYTGFDDNNAHLMLDRSKDLVNWEHVGRITEGKAGAIFPWKINGEYVMYQGDKDIDLWRSPNGTDWYREAKGVIERRDADEGYHDTHVVEPGPAPFPGYNREDDDWGIVQIYNGCDAYDFGSGGEEGTYHVFAAVFDPDDPTEEITRTDTPIFYSDEKDAYTRKDHLEQVAFAEGLVPHDGDWYMSFGSGDRDTRFATAPMKPSIENWAHMEQAFANRIGADGQREQVPV